MLENGLKTGSKVTEKVKKGCTKMYKNSESVQKDTHMENL